jgi:hypothetical protein
MGQTGWVCIIQSVGIGNIWYGLNGLGLHNPIRRCCRWDGTDQRVGFV